MDLGSIKETKLTIDEEREAIAHARAGSREAFDALIAAYVRNLRGAAWALVRAGSGGGRARVTREEAEQAALIALWDAVLAVDLGVEGWRVAGILQQHLAHAMVTSLAEGLGVTVNSRALSRYFGLRRRTDGGVGLAMTMATDVGLSTSTFMAVHHVVVGWSRSTRQWAVRTTPGRTSPCMRWSRRWSRLSTTRTSGPDAGRRRVECAGPGRV